MPDGAPDAVADHNPDTDGDATFDGQLPDKVPAGWFPWTGWSPRCPLYLPGPAADLPPPIEWVPCPDTVPAHLACRRMKITWTPEPYGIAAFPSFALDTSSGKPLLQFKRPRVGGDADVAYHLVVEADGDVRSAYLQVDVTDDACAYYDHDLQDDRLAINSGTRTGTITDSGKPALDRGAIGWRVGTLEPDTLLRLQPDTDSPEFSADWYTSARWLVGLELGRHTAWSWDLSEQHIVYRAGLDPDALPPHDAVVVDADVFSLVSTTQRCGVMSWDLDHGSRPLLRWYGETGRGAGNFGTDGKDMVWTYVEEPNACDWQVTSPAVWTAPYTTDPAVVAGTGRRVRADVQGVTAYPYVVGYGYAMRVPGGMAAPNYRGLWIVRLEDGMAWIIPGQSLPEILGWTRVLGFTEEELYVVASMRTGELDGATIVRIRLDSLGPGIPPD